jgi:hypothetical protein
VVGVVKSTLLAYGVSHMIGIIDPQSMYLTDRIVTLEFLDIVSEHKHSDCEFCGIFTEGYTYRRRGVPEFVEYHAPAPVPGYELQTLSCRTWEFRG